MNQDKKNRMKSMYATIGVHAVLLLFFFLMMAWTEPDPPISEYGIEFSLGNSIVRESNSEKPVVAEEISEVEEVTETVDNDTQEQSASADPDDAPVEEAAEQQTDSSESSDTDDINSPDVVEDKSKVSKTEKVKTVEEKSTGEDVNAKNEKEESKENQSNSKEVEKPSLDSRAIYKKKDGDLGGGNKGASLDLSGWLWDFKPRPNDQSIEIGKIVFQITIDDEGEIINVRTIEKTVSPVLEKVYRDAVMELTFSPTADNRSVAAQSTGRITFIIQSR